MSSTASTSERLLALDRLRGAVSNRRRLWRHSTRAAGFALLGALLAIRIWDPGPVEILRLKSLDAYQVLAPRPVSEQPVAIVDIDEPSLEALGQWPWSRRVVAELTARIMETGAAVVAFDIVFAERDRLSPPALAKQVPGLPANAVQALSDLPDSDTAFAQALARYRTVLGRFPLRAEERGKRSGLRSASIARKGPASSPVPLPVFPGALANLPALEAAAQGIGMLLPTQERDNIVRRVPSFVRVGDSVQPALFLEILRVATGQTTYIFNTTDEGMESVVVGGNAIPTDHRGRIWVHYAPSSPGLYVSAADVMDGRIPAQRLAGHLVLIGTSAVGLRDIVATLLVKAMPGVEVHAQLLQSILAGSRLDRPDFAIGAELVALIAIGLLIVHLVPKVGAWRTLAVGTALIAAAVAVCWWMFRSHQMLFDVSYPVLCSLLVFSVLAFMNYVREQQDRRQIRNAFSRYLAPEVVNRLTDSPAQLRLGGEMREMTLLFSDVQGFTGIAENYDAVGLTRLINEILTPVTSEILRTGGTVDKYMGDAVMALWNAPVDDSDHARNACRSALAINRLIGPLNERLARQADEAGHAFRPVNFGVGVNTGDCCVGNMGSDMRFDYSVLGDAVNLAARLEGQTRTYGVGAVVGERTRTQADGLAFLELDLITVKGKTVPERIYALLGEEDLAAAEAFSALTAQHEDMLAAYRAADWQAARAAAVAARAAAKEAGLDLEALYDLFERRIEVFAAEPPPPDWGGVFVATTKG